MNLFRRARTSEIPVVPSDEKERAEAIQQAEEKLVDTLNQVEKISQLADSIQLFDNNNHYILRIQQAYGRD